MEELLTIEDLAGMFKLSESHVRRRVVVMHTFPRPTVIGKTRRWPKCEVIDWLETNRERRAGRPRKATT